MIIKRPLTENERLLATTLLVLTVYFGINSFFPLFFDNQDAFIMHYIMTLSFLGGIAAGVIFLAMSKPKESPEMPNPLERNLEVLKRALTEDEALLLEIIKNSEGITQDSIRFRTGFSKSKVSALLLNLEKNGIITREKLGKTYKIAIGDWLRK